MWKISEGFLTSLIIVFNILVLSHSEGAFINLKVYESEWIRKLLTDPLNNVNVRPTYMNTSEPIEISVSLVVRNFDMIDEKNQEFSVQIILRQEWEDDRLAYVKFNPVQLRQMKQLTLNEPEKIWRPDTFFRNEKKASYHSIMKPNSYAKIYPNGTVIYDARLSLTLACPMDLRFFPFDAPTCTIQMASYALARDDIIFKWKPLPITVHQGASVPTEYFFDSVTSNYCDAQSGIGVYSCLLAEFHFRRSGGCYFKRMIIPVINFVIIGWLSFLLDYKDQKTFLLRGIMCLTALSLAFIKISSEAIHLPKTTYTTALDVWNGISLTFIFVALVEFIVVHYLTIHEFGTGGSTNNDNSQASRRSSGMDDIEMTRTKIEGSLNIEPENMEVERKKSVEVQTHWSKNLAHPVKIEKWTRILYPSIYAAFNLIFWLVCSNSGESR